MGGTMTTEVNVAFKRLEEEAKVPFYGSSEAAGADLHADVFASTKGDERMRYTLKPGERKLFKTGIALELPTGFYAKIEGRSGLAYKHGIAVLGGVIDSDYRGDIGVILLNTGTEDFEVKQDDRIAQLIIQPYVRAIFFEAELLGDTHRAQGGFGSTGVSA